MVPPHLGLGTPGSPLSLAINHNQSKPKAVRTLPDSAQYPDLPCKGDTQDLNEVLFPVDLLHFCGRDVPALSVLQRLADNGTS